MILKIERHNEEQDWWLLDNIAKISCSRIRYHTRARIYSLLGEDNYISVQDHKPNCNCGGEEKCKNCVPYYRLVCRTKDWDEICIAFDTITYICNDDGKTIEKIVANYKKY